MDLALTATYFPHCGLTFAVLFGCPLSVEEEILRRLSFATAEAIHPLLMPGIFAELERSRHVHIVEATIDELESRIFELDFQPSDMEGMPDSEAKKRNQEKRSAWLDTTYLRNALVSWSTQLAKIGHHADELKDTVFKPATSEQAFEHKRAEVEDDSSDVLIRNFKRRDISLFDQSGLSDASSDGWVNCTENAAEERPNLHEELVREIDSGKKSQQGRQRYEGSMVQQDPETSRERLRRVGHKINDRIQAIIDEYDDKIRDCTMRVDGMAMATQWGRPPNPLNFAKKANLIRLLVKQTLKSPYRRVETHDI